MEDAESLAQSAVERLSEDETLRGDLTDDGFSPLLTWAANAAIAYAQNLQSDKPDEAMDTYASRLKGVMQEVVAAAKAGKIEDPAPLLDFQMAQPEAAKTQLSDLKLAPGEDDANAIKITEVLSGALSATAPAPATENKPVAPSNDAQPVPTPKPETGPVSSSQPSASESSEKASTPPEVRTAHRSEKEAVHKPGPRDNGKSTEQHTGQQERANRIQAPSRSEQHSKETPRPDIKHTSDHGRLKN